MYRRHLGHAAASVLTKIHFMPASTAMTENLPQAISRTDVTNLDHAHSWLRKLSFTQLQRMAERSGLMYQTHQDLPNNISELPHVEHTMFGLIKKRGEIAGQHKAAVMAADDLKADPDAIINFKHEIFLLEV